VLEIPKDKKAEPATATPVSRMYSSSVLLSPSYYSSQAPLYVQPLAHAYHHQVLGYDDASVRAAFEHAAASGTYDDVLYCDGSRKKAYALNNDTEFFAELSEAWFGTNDFFPFVQAEVLASDPTSAAMLRKAWGE
jgi:dipeptidyl-peptidase-4